MKKFRPLLLLTLLLSFNMIVAKGQTCKDTAAAMPSIHFSGKSVLLSTDAKKLLEAVAQQIKDHPECRVEVKSYCQSNKREHQISWDRVNRVITFLIEKQGISPERFIFLSSESDGSCGEVDLRFSNGDGPSMVPPPYPNLRRSR